MPRAAACRDPRPPTNGSWRSSSPGSLAVAGRGPLRSTFRPARGSRARSLASGPSVVVADLGPGQKHQAEFADLNLVAVGQHGRIDRLPVDIGAIEAADVHDLKLIGFQPEFRVPTADGDVVEEDVAVGMATGRRRRLVE